MTRSSRQPIRRTVRRLRRAWSGANPPDDRPGGRPYAAERLRRQEGRTRPYPFSEVRVGHVGALAMFQSMAPHHRLLPTLAEDPSDYQLLMIEPDLGEVLDHAPGVVERFAAAGIPTVLIARSPDHLQAAVATKVDLVMAETASLLNQAERGPTLLLAPSVDDWVHNPVGWNRRPDGHLATVSPDAGQISDELTLSLGERHTVLGNDSAGGTSSTPPVGKMQAALVKEYVAVYAPGPDTANRHVQVALEVIAAGTPVIAPRHPTLDRLLADHYSVACSTEEVIGHLHELTDPSMRERVSVAARRHVLTQHTRRRRFEEVMSRLGMSVPLSEPTISVLLATNRPERLEAGLAAVDAQAWGNKELVLILHGAGSFDMAAIAGARARLTYPTSVVAVPSDLTLGQCLNEGLDHATGELVTKMDDDDHYGPHHLLDLYAAHSYSGAQVVGKASNIVYLEDHDMTIDWRSDREERFGPHLPGATMLLARDLLGSYRFDDVSHNVDGALWQRMKSDGLRLYSTHRFNFVRVRHGEHTYERSDDDFLAEALPDHRQGLDLAGSML